MAKAIPLSLGVAFGVSVIFWALRWRLVAWRQDKLFFRVSAGVAEIALPIAMAIIAGLFELWKVESWTKANTSIGIGLPLFALVVFTFFGLRIVGTVSENKNREDLDGLKSVLAAEQAKSAHLESQRDMWVRVSTHVKNIIANKEERFAKLASDGSPPGLRELREALGPEIQLNLILCSVHQFFLVRMSPSEQLRLGLYIRDPEDSSRLFLVRSWDGRKENCFSTLSQNFMRLDDPQGPPSAIVRCYHSPNDLLLFPSCHEEEKKANFHFFRPKQREYLKSMVVYKQTFGDAEPRNVIILTLDSSQEGLFGFTYPDEEIRQFLREMALRLIYELHVLAVCDKLPMEKEEVAGR